MFSLKGEFRSFQVVVVPGVLWRTERHTAIKYSQEYHPLTPPGRCIVTAAKCTKECVARACLLFWTCLLLKDFIQQQKRCSSSECQTNSSTSALIYLYNCKLFFSSFLSITCGQTFQGACKQQRPWRLRKRHEKSEFALLQTLSRLFGYSISFHSSMFLLFSGVEFWKNCVEVRSTSGKENESCCLEFTTSTKREVITLSWDESCRWVNVIWSCSWPCFDTHLLR